MLLSSDEEDFVPLKRKVKAEEGSRKKKAVKVDLNLSGSELPSTSKSTLPPFSIYLGGDIVVEVKPYRKENYIGFYRNTDGEIKNRFNINVKQVRTLKRAVESIIEHLESNDIEV
ncbi:hypothetical protein JTE90_003077 [Oedothorax gibbosus]|uniref:Uncharacterized protein n=1 Tax=Oedothorax gibbosus TaxID=931172 RepID=A0AAV6TQH5_9ARAC|nr:hypothetical protein JTE90_003077 [Oedothorax gibbosus]